MKGVNITAYNTYISISFSEENKFFTDDMKPLTRQLTSFKREWNHKLKRNIFTLDRHWYWLDYSSRTFYFPITVFNMVYKHIISMGYEVKQEDIKVIKDIPLKFMKGKFRSDVFKLRDYQEAYQDAVTRPNRSFSLVDLKTGAGKTLISFYCITKLGLKTGIILLPRYISKWIEDVEKYTDIPKERVYVVQGRDSLLKLLEENPENHDIVIFSLTTLASFIKDYETKEHRICKPWEIFNILGIGILLSDECHQALGSLSRIIMYSNVQRVIGLSATYIGNDAEDRRFKNYVFPEGTKISNIVKFTSHIDAYACPYRLDPSVRVKDKLQNAYNHVVFEQSIMTRTTVLQDYLKMVDYYLTDGYISRRKPGQKCLIFFSTITMCTYAWRYFSGKYPDLKIRRYIGEDSYDTMQEGDIIISTLGSFGTALETSNLITIIHTVCVKSTISNIQSAGRLRKIEGVQTKLYSLYCTSLQSHIYLQKSRELSLKGVVTLWKSKPYLKLIPEIFKRKKRNIYYS